MLLSATSHLLLGRKSLPHDAAGETPAVFHLKVRTNTNSDVQPATWLVHTPQPHTCETFPERLIARCSRRDGGLLRALQRPALCPRLDGGSSLIAIKSRSGSTVTFPLSCNQSGRQLMRPGHRLSISLTHTNKHTHTYKDNALCILTYTRVVFLPYCTLILRFSLFLLPVSLRLSSRTHLHV